MTTAHVEKFAEMLLNDPTLKARLTKHKENMSVYASTAVQEGKTLGLIFTADEFIRFVLDIRIAAAEGEMSDLELDAVSGGPSATYMSSL